MSNVRGKRAVGRRDGKPHSFFPQNRGNLQSKQVLEAGGFHPFKMFSQASDKNKGGFQYHTSSKQAFSSWGISLTKPQEGDSVYIKSLAPSSHSTDLLLRVQVTG